MVDAGPPIQATGLGKSFGSLTVLDGVAFEAAAGTMLALLGPNGAGKTTVVRILSTLLRPDAGTVRVNGYDVVAQAPQVRASIALTGQYAALDRLLTGRENLIMMGRLQKIGMASARRRADELLDRFDLRAAAHRPVRTYSGGMRRKLDLAVSLITSPPVIFLDEPTTGLDPHSRQTMWESIRELLRDGTTILLTTQYLEEADRLADKVVVLDGGKVIAEGRPEELKQRVGSDRLVLTFADAPTRDRATAELHDQQASADDETAGLHLPLRDVEQLRAILDRLAGAGIEVGGVAIAKPTLDDVFLTLTGKRIAGSEQQEDQPS